MKNDRHSGHDEEFRPPLQDGYTIEMLILYGSVELLLSKVRCYRTSLPDKNNFLWPDLVGKHFVIVGGKNPSLVLISDSRETTKGGKVLSTEIVGDRAQRTCSPSTKLL